MDDRRKKIKKCAILCLLLTGSLLIMWSSFSARNAAQHLLWTDHRDKIDLRLSRADDDFLDGNMNAAIAEVDTAQQEARAEMNTPRRRSQIVACAMAYCGYARKDKALDSLTPVLAYQDVTGRQAKQVFDSIQRGDRMWQPMHIPNSAERAQMKALKARLMSDPAIARKFVEQYKR